MKSPDALLARLRDAYDLGISHADRNLGVTLDALERHGFLDGPHRIIVTSDHGEFLGEHGRMSHGGTGLWEEVTRVPVVVYDSRGPIPLPEVFSATGVHGLALEGALTVPSGEAAAGKLSNSEEEGGPCPTTSAVIWHGDDKLRCRAGALERFDLATDPEEAHPESVDGHPQLGALRDLADALETVNSTRDDGHQAMEDGLKALGYVE